ncbi:MAG: hypothetical protein FWG49_03685 [Leptospirales bacterium]|nr:hypothetical protein [Leptospirales bacterium]
MINKIKTILFCASLLIIACITKPAPEPVLTEEMKQVQIVYGWDATDILEKAGCEGVRMETVAFNDANTYAVRARAVHLSANVAQVVYDKDVRFWNCGKAAKKREVDELPKIRLGELIGAVGGFDGAEVIVNGKSDAIGRQAPIGRTLIVDAKGEYVYLQSTFPMQTVVKCKITSGDKAHIKKGMKVYLKP